MVKYLVVVEILKVDENGDKSWDIIKHEFENESPIKARNNAIKKLNCLNKFVLILLKKQEKEV